MTIIPTSDALNETTVMKQVRKLAECINSRDGGLIENIELTEDNQVYTMTIIYANGQTQELEWDSVSVGIADITIAYSEGIYTFTFLLTDGTTKTFTVPIGDVVTEEELSTALSTKADTSTVNTLDAQNVKKTGTSVVTGDIQVPTTPTTPTSVVNSVYVNDATEGTNNIVHKTGNETIDGVKTLNNRLDSVWTSFDITQPNAGWQSKDIIVVKDKNLVPFSNMITEYNGTSNTSALRFMLLMPNGDSCGFAMRFENGTLKMELRKTVNGVYSSSNIGTL